MVKSIYECCYTCINCLIIKKVCKLKNKKIHDIYKDRCKDYTLRDMIKCKLCSCYIVELAPHVTNYHKKTLQEYFIMTKNIEDDNVYIRSDSLWD